MYVFFNFKNEITSAPTHPSSLAIFKINPEENAKQVITKGGNIPGALLQVGPWAYPLYPSLTTILKNDLGIYNKLFVLIVLFF